LSFPNCPPFLPSFPGAGTQKSAISAVAMPFLYSFLGLFFWFITTQAVLVNVTIDDSVGDPLTGASIIYTPSDAWNSGPAACNKCLVHPDVKKLESGTWHASTFSVNVTGNLHPNVPLSASVQFNGSAVYVFCALSRSSTAPDGDSDMAFYIDGVQAGSFTQRAIGSAGFDYRVPVYANTALTPGNHTIEVQNGQRNGNQSLMILDSIVYSYENGLAPASQVDGSPTTAPKHSTSKATLAVVAVLVVALLLLGLGLGVFLYRRRRHHRAVYARYRPKGAVHAFPAFLAPTPVSTPAPYIAPLPAVYAGSRGSGATNWWVGRDQKSRDGLRGVATHRPYADLDPSQAGLQRPQPWEHIV